MVQRRFTLANALAGVAVFIALGGGAYAASGSSLIGAGGTINGCVAKHGGTLKVAKPGRKCPKGTSKLAFNTAGTIGETGATGPTGAAGAPNPSATTVDGETVTKLFLKEPTPLSSMTILPLGPSIDGLTILAECDNGGNATLVANGPASADSELTFNGRYNSTAFGLQFNNLGAASDVMIGPPQTGEVSFSYGSSAGQVVSGQLGWASAPSLGSFSGCSFFGTVTSG
jgi:hypothetical protein